MTKASLSVQDWSSNGEQTYDKSIPAEYIPGKLKALYALENTTSNTIAAVSDATATIVLQVLILLLIFYRNCYCYQAV